ncbi:uncharacterized protein PRCAT00004387001 [Priceomyces carsonii]|uniref:uncharacterized protein n=1 Tax=Priceomyces carsonii TaxID=28549 RepID=UPI002ED8772D|nr:unnamed protein product [Priceomyces carsonii]
MSIETADKNDDKKNPKLSDKLGDAHMNLLPKRKLIVSLGAMSLGLFATFVDQTSLTVSLPQIGKDLNAQTTINWAATAQLMANTVCQVLFGRLADIFGRKRILLMSLGILAISDLCCGFAQTGVQFYVFRAFAGIGQGGTQSLTMVIVSDIVTLKQRGKYQGILGSQVGLGNAIGPFLMSAFIEHSSWRNFYHMMPGLVALVMLTIFFTIDNNKAVLDSVISNKEKFKKIDYLGMLFSTASLTLLLVPISGGGSTYAWDSTKVIVMFVIGGVCMVIFLIIEWKIPILPMIPLSLFSRPSLALILGSNFCFGLEFYAFIYYIPYYFQIVKKMDSIHSAILILPLVLTQSVSSIIAGNLISFTGKYKLIILTGYGLWFTSCCLLLLFKPDTHVGIIVLVLLIMGCGTGWTFQPTIVAVQAHSKKSERAVVIGCRNVLRSFGGSVGVAVSSLIMSNTLLNKISEELNKESSDVPKSYLLYLKKHIYSKIELSGLDEKQISVVQDMYMGSMRNLFYLYIPLIGVCFISTIFIVDRGLLCIDEAPPVNATEDKKLSTLSAEEDCESHYTIEQIDSETNQEVKNIESPQKLKLKLN